MMPLHERLRGLDAEDRCVLEVLASIGIGEGNCGIRCNKCIANAFEALADEIERNYELRDGAYASKHIGTGADGLPIRDGDEVYVAPQHASSCGEGLCELKGKAGLHGYSYGEMRIAEVHGDDNNEVTLKATGKNDGAWCPASWLTHTPPDTQERIDKGKRMNVVDYWDCSCVDCLNCTLGGDGVIPAKRYGVFNCVVAQGMDIARRQAELDALLGGDA